MNAYLVPEIGGIWVANLANSPLFAAICALNPPVSGTSPLRLE
jgi:hypothetical protein